jgi:hypothetical protein
VVGLVNTSHHKPSTAPVNINLLIRRFSLLSPTKRNRSAVTAARMMTPLPVLQAASMSAASPINLINLIARMEFLVFMDLAFLVKLGLSKIKWA